MKKFNKILIIGLAVFALVATSLTAFAVTANDEIKNDEVLWEEFQKEMLESKKAFLDEKVADGTLLQEDADEIYNNMQERQEYCRENGTGFGGMMGFKNNNGFGGMMGYGNNQGRGCGRGWQ